MYMKMIGTVSPHEFMCRQNCHNVKQPDTNKQIYEITTVKWRQMFETIIIVINSWNMIKKTPPEIQK